MNAHRLIVLFVCLAGASAFFCGCGSSGGDARTLKFWAMGAEGENVKQLIPEFERRNPGIHVGLQVVPWTAAHEKLLTAYAGNSTPDICQLGNTWVPEFHILNALEDLRPWIGRSQAIRRVSYFDGIWETNIVDSALYGIPWYVDTRVLFYRTDLLEAAGYPHPPGSWDEWSALSARIKANAKGKEVYAVLLPTNEWPPPVILGLQAGSGLLKDANTLGDFSGPAFRRGFDFYASFFRNGTGLGSVTKVTNIYQGITEGYFAMYISGPWNIGEFRRRIPAEMQDKWMTAPMPGPAGQTPGLSLAGGSSLAMFRASAKKEDVWKLIEFLSEPLQQVEFYRITGDLPARKEAWEDSSLATNPYVRAFYEQLNHVVPTPKIPEWEQIAMKVQEYAEVASMGKMTVDETLEALDRDVNRILEKRRWLVHGR